MYSVDFICEKILLEKFIASHIHTRSGWNFDFSLELDTKEYLTNDTSFILHNCIYLNTQNNEQTCCVLPKFAHRNKSSSHHFGYALLFVDLIVTVPNI